MLSKNFGATLRETRIEQGLSQEDLGFKSGLHRTYISLLERGLKSPSLHTIFKLSQALGLPPSEFFARLERNLGRGIK
ncbi:MAG: helix-turn-helix transcriptional regulator [Pseudomonadota bacterium]